MRRFFAFCFFVVFEACGVAGQSPSSVVEARLVLTTAGAHAGELVKAAVVAQVTPGYHINDHKVTQDYLIPTELKLEPSKRLDVVKVVYPKGELKKFAFMDVPLSVYEGTVFVGAVLKFARATPPGTYTIKGTLSYQACNDHACLPPANAPFTLAIKLVLRGVPLKQVNSEVLEKVQFD